MLPAAVVSLAAVTNRISASDVLTAAGIDPAAVRVVMPRVDPVGVAVRVAPRWFYAIWAKKIVAVALPVGIFVKPEVMTDLVGGSEPERWGKLIVHELMHIEQWRRRGGFRHVSQYVGDYLRGRCSHRGHWEAYRGIRQEVEARQVASRFPGGGLR